MSSSRHPSGEQHCMSFPELGNVRPPQAEVLDEEHTVNQRDGFEEASTSQVLSQLGSKCPQCVSGVSEYRW